MIYYNIHFYITIDVLNQFSIEDTIQIRLPTRKTGSPQHQKDDESKDLTVNS